jgi:anti-sigma factor RsiW
MNCQQCDERLIDYVVAELAPDERAAVARHLAGCPTCAVASCRLRADLDGVAQAAAMSPPPALRARVRAAAAASFRPPWWRRTLASGLRPVPAYGLAVASLLPVIVWASVHAWADRTDHPTPTSRPVVVADYDASAPLTRTWNVL